MANTHKDNAMTVSLAPGEGLLLEEVSYEKYNRMPATCTPIMIKLVCQKREIEAFRKEIVSFIARRELTDKIFNF